MQNLNQYNKELFMPFFQSHKIYEKIRIDYKKNNLSWEKFFYQSPKIKTINPNHNGDTPREVFAEVFSMSVFYYLLPLLEKDYDIIYDLGCGSNMFKVYIPRLLGVGAEHASVIKYYNDVKDPCWPIISDPGDFAVLPEWIKNECTTVHNIQFDVRKFHGDVHGFVDDQYISEHRNYFQAVFSICALHFQPVDQFQKVITDFVSMVKLGGRGFISLNLMRMIEITAQEKIISLIGKKDYNKLDWERYLRSQINEIYNVKWLIVDIDLTLLDESMNGNVRLVFEKQ